MAPIAGIFIGGRGHRLGGVAKGLLTLRGDEMSETIISRTRRVLEAVGCECILVGKHEAYGDEPALTDDPRAEGPLAGLIALLAHAGARTVLAIACDMPLVSETAVRALLAAPARAAIVAPRRGDRWEPFFARYDAERVLPLALAQAKNGDHRLQSLFADAAELALDDERVLVDWDTPDDLPYKLRT